MIEFKGIQNAFYYYKKIKLLTICIKISFILYIKKKLIIIPCVNLKPIT